MNAARTPNALVVSILTTFGIAAACSGTKESTSSTATGSSSTTSAGTLGAGGSSSSGSNGTITGIISTTGTTGGGGGGDGAASGPCVNLTCRQTTCTLGACQEMPCAGGAKTTVSGTVYDPAGKVPLYNVIVYVPNGAVPPVTAGVSCDRCAASTINPAAYTLTDTQGRFVLDDVPVGANIPLVIQVGKWRRQIMIPNVPRCTDTPLTNKELTRLPRNKSEGDIPLIAIATGGADSMECLPLRMGIDPGEFSTEAGAGRIHLYYGQDNPPGGDVSTKTFDATLNGGAMLSAATTLWNSVENLKKYDVVILSCEGAPNPDSKLPAARQVLYDYESVGGRVFASHYHHLWFSGGPAPVPQIATWRDLPDPTSPSIGLINTTFPKGRAMSEWLVNVGASMVPGQLEIRLPRDNVTRVNTMMATEWIRLMNQSQAVEFLSFNAPLNVVDDRVCGRAVYNDLHVSRATGDRLGMPFPASCALGDLSAQEKALEFMLFDLSSCVTRDDLPPPPPPPPR